MQAARIILRNHSFIPRRCFYQPAVESQVVLPKPLSQHQPGQASYVKNFRCEESDPSKHTPMHASTFYKIPDDVIMRMMTKDAFNGQYRRHSKAMGEHTMMIRSNMLEVVNYLKCADYSLPVNKYLLYGGIGTGKTMTLHYAVHYALSQNWLVLNCLNTRDWTHYHHSNREDKLTEVMKSTYDEGRFDQPEKAGDWLVQFKRTNEKLLNTLHTTRRYEWSRRDVTEEGSTFTQLIDLGIARIRYAPDVFGALVLEIMNQSKTNDEFPRTLVAVDAVNVMFERLRHIKMKAGHYPHAHEMSYFHHVRKLMNGDWKNGAVVCAISDFKNGEVPFDIECHPYDSITQQGFDCLDPHIPVEVDKYDDREILSHLAYYKDMKWLNNKSLTEAGEAEIIQLSDHNPSDLVKLCAHLS